MGKLPSAARLTTQYSGLATSQSAISSSAGRAAIKPDAEQVVLAMLKTLTPYVEKYGFAVEGHTDATPIVGSAQFASNWELSSARAIMVRQRLEDVGIGKSKIRVEGYADTKPLTEAQLKGLSEEQRLARHRRVVVRIF